MQKIKIIFINTLIVCYLSVIYFTGVPETNTFNERLKKKLQPIAFALGIWPSWSMFAPNPIKFDSKTFVEYQFTDGSSETKDIEKNTEGILAPFRQARWMKYSQDNLRSPRLTALRPLAVKHFYNSFSDPSRTISKIIIKRAWKDIQPFKETNPLPPLDNSYIDKEFSEVLYTHTYE